MEVRSALFWDFAQRKMVVTHRCYGQPISPNFTGEDGTYMARNVVTDLPFYAAQNAKREQISLTPWHKPEVTCEYTERSTPAARDPRFEAWSKEKYLDGPHGFPMSFYVNGILVS